MSQKKMKTECSGMAWGDFLLLIDGLKKEKEFRFLLFAAIGTYCGLRASDILNLRWKDILNKSEILIVEKKTSKARQITINQNLAEIVKSCNEHLIYGAAMKNREDEFVFCNKSRDKISIQYINRKLHEIFENSRLKVQNPSTHVFRKTFGKRIYEMNGKSPESLVLLSQIFGHSSIAITRKYIGIIQEQIQNVYISL